MMAPELIFKRNQAIIKSLACKILPLDFWHVSKTEKCRDFEYENGIIIFSLIYQFLGIILNKALVCSY